MTHTTAHPTSPAGSDPGSGRPTRTEHDLLGELEVPHDAYYGIHTLRARKNFTATRRPLSAYPTFVAALAAVKQATAMANAASDQLDPEVAAAIISACDRIRTGALLEEFVVDLVQGGAGTSTNMNANEVIANLALEILSEPKGNYHRVHPLDHVNKSQSTNDVYPTALRVALHLRSADVARELTRLAEACENKAAEFSGIAKVARTQLQDAVPMTVGREFQAFAVTLRAEITLLGEARDALCAVNLGGTAIGTSLNTPAGYPRLAREHLAALTGVPVHAAQDLVEATQDVGPLVQLSSALKRTAIKLSKICNDLRLLASGPRCGLGELRLPPRQAGSSMMPGKVNPVIPELVNQIAFTIIGRDTTITLAAEAGQLQLNAFEPVIAGALFDSLDELTRAIGTLTDHCITGITVDSATLRRNTENAVSLVTALLPKLGYETATRIAAEAVEEGATVRQIVGARQLVADPDLDVLLGGGQPEKPDGL